MDDRDGPVRRLRRTTSVGGFWRYVAVNFVIAFGLILGTILTAEVFIILYMLFLLATIVPSLAAGVRRLHDSGKTGWMILLGLIPFIGFLILIFLYVQPSDGPNEWGSGPED